MGSLHRDPLCLWLVIAGEQRNIKRITTSYSLIHVVHVCKFTVNLHLAGVGALVREALPERGQSSLFHASSKLT